MPVAEKSAQEIQVEQLTQLVAKLASEQKAKESAIKELNTQIKLAEAESASKIKAATDAYTAHVQELEAKIMPLRGQVQDVASLTAEIAKLKQAKLDAASEVKSAKNLEIQAANAVIDKAASRLGAIEQAIATCKEAVAGL